MLNTIFLEISTKEGEKHAYKSNSRVSITYLLKLNELCIAELYINKYKTTCWTANERADRN